MSSHAFSRRDQGKAQELCGGYCATGGFLDPVALRQGAGYASLQYPQDVGLVLTQTVGYFLDRHPRIPDQVAAVRKYEFVLHGVKSVSLSQDCQEVARCINSDLLQTLTMPRWNYRDAFDAAYWEVRTRLDLTDSEVAEAMGCSPHTLASYRRKGNGGSIPSEDKIRRFAALCGLSPFTFMDDPRVGESVGLGAWASLPQWQRDLLQRNARLMDGTPLTPEQWALLVDRLGADARAMAALMESAKKKK